MKSNTSCSAPAMVKSLEWDNHVSIGQLGKPPMLTVGVGEVEYGHN